MRTATCCRRRTAARASGPRPLLHGEAPRPAALGHYILAASGALIVRSGFTTVRDVGSFDDEASALKLAVDLGVVPGPRILTCGRIISATAPGGAIFGTMYREADGPWEMRKAVREQIRRGADYIKFMATGARSVVAEDPEPPQMTLEEMARDRRRGASDGPARRGPRRGPGRHEAGPSKPARTRSSTAWRSIASPPCSTTWRPAARSSSRR